MNVITHTQKLATLVVATVAVAGLAGYGTAVAQADPYEPNDSAMQATLLHGSTDYNAAIDTVADEDWYVFYSEGAQQVVMTLANGLPSGYQYVYVIAPDGDLVTPGGAAIMSRPLTSYFPVKRGRYYVRVIPGSTQSPASLGPYVLRLVPSNRFVNGPCLESQDRLNGAMRAVTKARSAVNNDNAAIARDKAGMRREGRTGKGPKWRMWQRRLFADQGKLSSDKRRSTAARARLASIQSAIRTNCAAL